MPIFPIKINLAGRIYRILKGIKKALDRIALALETGTPPFNLQLGVEFMTIIPDDAKPFKKVVKITPRDSEGNPITRSVPPYTFEAVSDNPDAIAVRSEPTGKNEFTLHYTVGSPGAEGADAIANVNVTVTRDADGALLAAGVDSYTVTTGDVATSEIVFGDAQPEPEPVS